MACSGDILVLQQPGMNFDEEKDSTKKKRFFKLKNFKQLFTRKKRVKSKEDDDEFNAKAKSTTNVHLIASEDGPQDTTHLSVSSTGALSVSHDSVFTPEKPREVATLGATLGVLKSTAVSMDRLPGGNPFASELTDALKRRRGNSSEDEALPESPYTNPNATQAVIENGLKNAKKSQSYDSCQSDRSLMSMDSTDNELEEDFFHETWTSSTSLSKRTASPDGGSGGSDIDLDVIAASQASLNTAAARHRIAIKPKTTRPVSHISQRRRANSPRTVTSNVRVMPEVQEENASKTKPRSSPTEEVDKGPDLPTADESVSTLPETKPPKSPRTKVKFQEPDTGNDETNKPNVDIIVADTSSISAPKPIKSIISSSKPAPAEKPVKPLKLVQSPPPEKQESPTSPFKNVVLRKTVVHDSVPSSGNGGSFKDKHYNYDNVIPGVEVKKEEIIAKPSPEVKSPKVKKKETIAKPSPEVKSPEVKSLDVKPLENAPDTTEVVMRQKSTALQDSSKRKTIGSGSGSESEMSVFGERKLKRASLVEPRDWDNLDKSKTKPDTSSSDASPDNEFSQIFSKFQRRASQKRDNHPELKAVDIKDTSDTSPEGSSKCEAKTSVVVKSDSKPIHIVKSNSKTVNVVKSDSKSAEKAEDESNRPAEIVSASSSVSKKSTPSSAKPSSLSIQASTKSGQNQANEVPLVTSSKTVSDTSSKSTKEDEKSTPFVLRSVGGSNTSSARAKSVFIGAKSNTPLEAASERPKTVLIEKPRKDNEKGNVSDSKTKPVCSDSVVDNKTKTTSDSVQSTDKKSAREAFPKKTLIIEEKSQSQNTTAKQNSTNSERNVTLVLNKQQTPSYVRNNKTEKDENTKPSSDATKPAQSSNIHKRASPLPKDRSRSHTLPEHNAAPKDILQQKTDNKTETKNSPSPNMPQRSKSMVTAATKTPSIKKLEVVDKHSGDNKSDNKASTTIQSSGQPNWISLARKKTGIFKDDEQETETKSKVVQPPPKEECKKEDDKAPSIQDLMKRFQKTK